MYQQYMEASIHYWNSIKEIPTKNINATLTAICLNCDGLFYSKFNVLTLGNLKSDFIIDTCFLSPNIVPHYYTYIKVRVICYDQMKEKKPNLNATKHLKTLALG